MRKHRAERREVKPDSVYDSVLVNRFINKIMLDGKKSLAESLLYDAMEDLQEDTGDEPITILEEAVGNVMPTLEVKSRRIGGSNYQVPVEVSDFRRRSLAIRWIVNDARSRNERTMKERITKAIMDAYNNTGGAVRKKEEIHRMAEANRAFAHYGW
ncbi:MAG: 30S ribosomal protein S7 [Halanaerobiales bacterium]|nr:30S ribosomal protein S7 [Halanaerobiales bacterium]